MRTAWPRLLILGLALSPSLGFTRERGFSAYGRIEGPTSHDNNHPRAQSSQGRQHSGRGAVKHNTKGRVNCNHSAKEGKRPACRDPFTSPRRGRHRPRREATAATPNSRAPKRWCTE